MKTIDYLRPDDAVKITILSPDDAQLYQSTETGCHNLDEAIMAAVVRADLKINPEDCVFEVTNLKTDVTHKYRINAHGNLKLIV